MSRTRHCVRGRCGSFHAAAIARASGDSVVARAARPPRLAPPASRRGRSSMFSPRRPPPQAPASLSPGGPGRRLSDELRGLSLDQQQADPIARSLGRVHAPAAAPRCRAGCGALVSNRVSVPPNEQVRDVKPRVKSACSGAIAAAACPRYRVAMLTVRASMAADRVGAKKQQRGGPGIHEVVDPYTWRPPTSRARVQLAPALRPARVAPR